MKRCYYLKTNNELQSHNPTGDVGFYVGYFFKVFKTYVFVFK